MLKIQYIPYVLKFSSPSGTSRGILFNRPSWFIKAYFKDNPELYGLGECAPIKGLSRDPYSKMEDKLTELCQNNIDIHLIDLHEFPSIYFGLETALKDLSEGGNKKLFKNLFTNGNTSIKINGLIWMGKKHEMLNRIKSKIKDGFNCLKLKIGAIDFNEELYLIKHIRKEFNENDLEIRLDANGAFDTKTAIKKIDMLSKFNIHSLEQPIQPGQFEDLKNLIANSAIDIALDEELIPIINKKKRKSLLEQLNPNYIILKPSLLGGFDATNHWINIADQLHIKWWITSALESNIGLNAIAQFTAEFDNPLPQGLGTGKIYQNNISSPLEQVGEYLKINQNIKWNDKPLNFN